ncbi:MULTISPECIES: hypothetical protein [Corallococcus]|uniref:hypothetical protein n=1 Tax=Corallococcus TaxID=83461 RepID=UPI0011C4384D|nr:MULTISPECIES: hypothetical protein [Corallococcus]
MHRLILFAALVVTTAAVAKPDTPLYATGAGAAQALGQPVPSEWLSGGRGQRPMGNAGALRLYSAQVATLQQPGAALWSFQPYGAFNGGVKPGANND